MWTAADLHNEFHCFHNFPECNPKKWMNMEYRINILTQSYDRCGICPVVGRCFKCLDCPDQIGYDLCDRCAQRNERGELRERGCFNQVSYKYAKKMIDPNRTLFQTILSFFYLLGAPFNSSNGRTAPDFWISSRTCHRSPGIDTYSDYTVAAAATQL